jgi:hypothetical protein
MSEVVKATRPTSKNTDVLSKWLEGAAEPSNSNGSQVFSQLFEGAAFDCSVPHGSGSKLAKLISPQLAARFWMSELSNRSEAVVKRAMKLVTLLADVALNDLCQEALGMFLPQSPLSRNEFARGDTYEVGALGVVGHLKGGMRSDM